MLLLAAALSLQVLTTDADHLCEVAAHFVRQPRTMVERTTRALGIQRTWTDDEVTQIAVPFGLLLAQFPEVTNLRSSQAADQWALQFRQRVQSAADGTLPTESPPAPDSRQRQQWARCELAGY